MTFARWRAIDVFTGLVLLGCFGAIYLRLGDGDQPWGIIALLVGNRLISARTLPR